MSVLVSEDTDISVTVTFRKVKLLFEMMTSEKTRSFISELHKISESNIVSSVLMCFLYGFIKFMNRSVCEERKFSGLRLAFEVRKRSYVWSFC